MTIGPGNDLGAATTKAPTLGPTAVVTATVDQITAATVTAAATGIEIATATVETAIEIHDLTVIETHDLTVVATQIDRTLIQVLTVDVAATAAAEVVAIVVADVQADATVAVVAAEDLSLIHI